jgi:hypothetical protein
MPTYLLPTGGQIPWVNADHSSKPRVSVFCPREQLAGRANATHRPFFADVFLPAFASICFVCLFVYLFTSVFSPFSRILLLFLSSVPLLFSSISFIFH